MVENSTSDPVYLQGVLPCAALFGLVSNCILNFILERILGFDGIVYSWTFSCLLSTGVLLLLLTIRRQRQI